MISKELQNKMNIHHLVLTVVDASQTEIFYSKIFGKPLYADSNTVMYPIGPTMLIFKQKENPDPLIKKFNPIVIGLEHFAFAIKSLEELQTVEKTLNENQIEHSGIHIDNSSKKEKIWLNDPSNIRIEFYL